MKTIENRKSPRRECVVPVEGQQGCFFDNVCALDISQGGLGFLSVQPVPLRKKIAVEVDLGFEQDPVLMLAEVKWVKPLRQGRQYRVGMKFVKVLLSGSISRLKQYFQE